MIHDCRNNKLPDPTFSYSDSGFVVEFRKDIYSQEILEAKKFDPQHIKILLFTKQHGSINNTQVQELCEVSKRTATRYLQGLEPTHLIKSGETGKGTSYMLKGPQRGQNEPKGAKNEKTSIQEIASKALKTYVNKDIEKKKLNAAINTPNTPTKNNVRKTTETSETQRGHKGAKTFSKGPNDEEFDLDKSLELFIADLDDMDPDQVIKGEFNRETLIHIYDTWLGNLLEKAIKTAEKFENLFSSCRHNLNAVNGYWSFSFAKASAEKVVAEFRKQTLAQTDETLRSKDIAIQLNFHFNAFKKAGLKAFNCYHSFEVAFTNIGYAIYTNKAAQRSDNPIPDFENLLHKPLQQKDINKLCTKLGKEILEQIQEKTKVLSK